MMREIGKGRDHSRHLSVGDSRASGWSGAFGLFALLYLRPLAWPRRGGDADARAI